MRPASDTPAAILATAVVPWTERHEFDEPKFKRQVHAIARNLTRHIYVFGTAGEGYAVSERQFDLITRAFWESAREAGVEPMVGLISLSLPTIIGRIERCVSLRHCLLAGERSRTRGYGGLCVERFSHQRVSWPGAS